MSGPGAILRAGGRRRPGRRQPATAAAALTRAVERGFAALGPDDVTRADAAAMEAAGLVRVEWCAVLTDRGVRAAAALARGGETERQAAETGGGRVLSVQAALDAPEGWS